MVYIYKPSTQEDEASVSMRDQPRLQTELKANLNLHSKILSQKSKNPRNYGKEDTCLGKLGLRRPEDLGVWSAEPYLGSGNPTHL